MIRAVSSYLEALGIHPPGRYYLFATQGVDYLTESRESFRKNTALYPGWSRSFIQFEIKEIKDNSLPFATGKVENQYFIFDNENETMIGTEEIKKLIKENNLKEKKYTFLAIKPSVINPFQICIGGDKENRNKYKDNKVYYLPGFNHPDSNEIINNEKILKFFTEKENNNDDKTIYQSN